MNAPGEIVRAPERRWLRPEEAAEYMRIGRTTLYDIIGERSIPTYKIGAVTLLKASEVDEYIQAHRRA